MKHYLKSIKEIISAGRSALLQAPLALMMALVMAVFASCSADHEDEPQPQPEPQPTEVERVLIVYMAANNSLGYTWVDSDNVQHTDDGDDLQEMLTAVKEGALQGNRLIVMHRPYRKKAQIKEVTPDGIKVLADLGDDPTCLTVEGMKNILSQIRRLAPAEKYGIVMWSHGSGWMFPSEASHAPALRSFGQDGQRVMTIPDLAEALAPTAPDFVYFDCCFMAGVEVAYELRGVTDAIVASASELPFEGMPYDQTLRYLAATEPNLPRAAEATFRYYENQEGYFNTCTISVIATEPLNRLAAECRSYYGALNQLTSAYGIQQYVFPGEYYAGKFYDFEDYLEHLSANASNTADAAQLESVRAALHQAVIYKANTPALWSTDGVFSGITVERHCGLTTGIPLSRAAATSSGYARLQWWADVASHLTYPN